MRHLTGYATLTLPVGSVKESDTFTCVHCNSVRHTKPMGHGFIAFDPHTETRREHEFVRCGQCDGLICENCVGKDCLPFEKKLAEFEAAAALYERIKRGG